MKTFVLTVAMGLLSASMWAQDEGLPDPKAAVTAALETLRGAGNYSFMYKPDIDTDAAELARFADSMRDGVEGQVDISSGVMLIRSKRGDVLKKGEKIAVKGEDGTWAAPERKAPKEGAEGQEGPKRQGRGMGMRMARIEIPHVRAAEALEGVAELKASEQMERLGEVDCTVYSGDLTEERAGKVVMGPLGRMGERAKTSVEGASGSLRYWISDRGTLVKFEIAAKGKINAEIQGETKSFEIDAIYTTEISKAGESAIEIPDEAKAILESIEK